MLARAVAEKTQTVSPKMVGKRSHIVLTPPRTQSLEEVVLGLGGRTRPTATKSKVDVPSCAIGGPEEGARGFLVAQRPKEKASQELLTRRVGHQVWLSGLGADHAKSGPVWR